MLAGGPAPTSNPFPAAQPPLSASTSALTPLVIHCSPILHASHHAVTIRSNGSSFYLMNEIMVHWGPLVPKKMVSRNL